MRSMTTRWLRLILLVSASALNACSGSPDPALGGVGKPANTDDGAGDSQEEGDGDVGDGDDDDDDGDGDGNGDGDEGCGSITKEAKIERGPVDIIWVIDSSGSMDDEFFNVMSNLSAFADGLNKSGANAKVVTMHGFSQLLDPVSLTPFGMDPKRYKYLNVNVSSWDALTQLIANFDKYKSFLRPDAPTHVLVVSDDESITELGGMTGADFKSQMEAKLGHGFFFHAVVADGKNGCNGFNVGTTYMTLADETKGEKLPICTSDWSGLFKKLESAVIASAPLPCDFEVPAPPAGMSLDPNLVDVGFTAPGAKTKESFPKAMEESACGDRLGWFFDDNAAPTRIEFCPSACTKVKAGGSIGIAFGCEPTVLL
jgi:hypothetical protein